MICPEGLAASITAAAAAIANGREADELALISSVFMQLGDTLATISAARLLDDDKKGDTSAEKT